MCGFFFKQETAYELRISDWSSDVCASDLRGTFASHGIAEDAVDVVRVPGAWEIPAVAARIAAGGGHAAIIALGCVIRGDTRHFEHVADRCAARLLRVAPDYRAPVANGVLAVADQEEPARRAGGRPGTTAAETAPGARQWPPPTDKEPGP